PLGNVDGAMLENLSAELKRINALLWDIEDAIRDCDARDDFGDAFIAHARAIYRLNDERSRLKKALNLASASRIVAEKSYQPFQRAERRSWGCGAMVDLAVTLPAPPSQPRTLPMPCRRLGGVLLSAPLIRHIRGGYPRASLDVLVFRGSERILRGNPDIDNVLTIPQQGGVGQALALWRRYDLAVSTQAGDRPTVFALIAGRRPVGLVPAPGVT